MRSSGGANQKVNAPLYAAAEKSRDYKGDNATVLNSGRPCDEARGLNTTETEVLDRRF